MMNDVTGGKMGIRRPDFYLLKPITLAMPTLLGFGCILMAARQLND
ncbi:MAG: hypothetical protein GY847_11210 [Proteobacteria bacterium]|nr:hypothetical protein [Pseudomonadota bacterium]